MDENKIIKLEKILNQGTLTFNNLAGGSDDTVLLVKTSKGIKYVYKSGKSESIQTQVMFYKEYANLLYLPELFYYSSNELLIEYFELVKSKLEYDKVEIMTQLLENFIVRYKHSDIVSYGFVSGFLTANTFADFLVCQLKEAHTYVTDMFSNKELNSLSELAKQIYSGETFETKYLLHGDLGFHNLFFSNTNLLGIIDPDPIVGHPLYDLLFSYCSTPDQINPESYNQCINKFNQYFPIDLTNKVEYLRIALFKRISSSRKHHPDDLEKYMTIWNSLNSFE